MSASGVNGDPAVAAVGLSMRFGAVQALENVSFTVHPGTILGLLGPNGAGKTTAMRILTTYLAPTSGSATVAGFDVLKEPHEVRRRIGYLPESVPVYGEMEAKEYLEFVGHGRGLGRHDLASRLDWVVEACAIKSVLRRPISELSKGFRQRVAMAQALIHDPEILILDEPTSGLDPIQIVQIRKLIVTLSERKTILLSSHVLREVEEMSERMVLIDGGHVVAEGDTIALCKQAGLQERVRLLVESGGPTDLQIIDALREIRGVADVLTGDTERPGTLSFDVVVAPGERVIQGIVETAQASGWTLVDIRTVEARLENAFVKLMKGERA